MEHTILTQGNQQAVIVEQGRFQFAVTAYVKNVPTVAYDTTTFANAERWAKVVIGDND